MNHGITSERALEMLTKPVVGANPESAILLKTEKIKTGDDGKDIFSITYKIPESDKFRQKMRDLYDREFGNEVNEELNYYERHLMSTPSPFKNGIKVVSQCKPGSIGDRWAGYVNNNENKYVPSMFTDEEQMVKDIEEMDTDNAYKTRGGLNKAIVKETDCGAALQGGGDEFEDGEYSRKLGNKIISRTFAEGKKRTVFMTEDQVRYIKKTIDEATASTSDVTPASELAYPAFTDAETANHKNICSDPELMKGGVAAGKQK
jgi:hypothetical protein